eukprot:scaffold116065_cov30-Tisochrysis_lutea.AAC.1
MVHPYCTARLSKRRAFTAGQPRHQPLRKKCGSEAIRCSLRALSSSKVPHSTVHNLNSRDGTSRPAQESSPPPPTNYPHLSLVEYTLSP